MIKALIPVDVSHPHDDLIDHLSWLIQIKGNEFSLLFVKETLPAYENVVESMADFPDDWENQLEGKAKELLSKLKKKLETNGATVGIEIASGATTSVIKSFAASTSADLIVVSPGKSAHIRRYLLGSTSSQVVKHAIRPVLVLRDNEKYEKLDHIVFAVDGSDDSHSAIEWTVKKFNMVERGIKASVVNVVSVAPALAMISPAPFLAQLETNLMLAGGVIVAKAENQLHKLGVKSVETKVSAGDAATELIKYSEENRAQLIVSGRKGHSNVAHIIMGSVAERLSAHSTCSNLIVNTGKEGVQQ